MNINYTTDADIFANAAYIDSGYFELLDGCTAHPDRFKLQPEMIIALSILSESIVLHEKLISPFLGRYEYYAFDGDLYWKCFSQAFKNQKFIYESLGSLNKNEIYETYEKCLAHGIPIIDCPSALSRHIDASIPKDLLNAIDKKRIPYEDKLREYLGNTYVGLPSIISIILDRAKDIDDIPNQMLLLREELSEFRLTCTHYEYTLRTEDSFLHQCQIIDEIKNAINQFNFDGATKKRRIIKQTAEILSLDPVSIGASIVSKAADLAVDFNVKLKIPGYYDLYKASFDVRDNLKSLKKLFGSQIDTVFLNQLNKLQKTEQGNKP